MWTMSLTTRNDTHLPITHPFLGRIFLLTPLFSTLLGGLLIEMFHVYSSCFTCILWKLIIIFVSASGTATPYDVTGYPIFNTI